MGGMIFWILPLPYALGVVVLFYTIVFTIPVDRSFLSLSSLLTLRSWPPANRLSYLMKCAVDYFSVRFVLLFELLVSGCLMDSSS